VKIGDAASSGRSNISAPGARGGVVAAPAPTPVEEPKLSERDAPPAVPRDCAARAAAGARAGGGDSAGAGAAGAAGAGAARGGAGTGAGCGASRRAVEKEAEGRWDWAQTQ
jgi:hypothetical protein